jgi:hypothetical protein
MRDGQPGQSKRSGWFIDSNVLEPLSAMLCSRNAFVVARRRLGLGERVLALAACKTRQELYAACPSDRPNHVGIALQRHIRAGRIQERDGKLYSTPTATDQDHSTA